LPNNYTVIKENYEPTHTYTIAGNCVECKTRHTADVPAQGMFWYNQGEFVQKAFPDLSADLRELFFISGVCKDCWDAIFSGNDDFDDSED